MHTDLTKPISVKFSSITDETRKLILEMYMTSPDNSYQAIGEKFGLKYSMIARVVSVEMGEYKNRKNA